MLLGLRDVHTELLRDMNLDENRVIEACGASVVSLMSSKALFDHISSRVQDEQLCRCGSAEGGDDLSTWLACLTVDLGLCLGPTRGEADQATGHNQ